ncbi:GTR11 protein, partial [Eubucco bourcierii]|nr:GTR11 protein [Eubucco bourcierii]
PCAACCPRKKCLLLNDVVLIIGSLHVGFSRRARAWEMILAGRLLEGFSAGRPPHCSTLV